MTNQNPNQTEETEETTVVPQRTFAQWLAHCQTIIPGTPESVIVAAVLVPGELRWENDSFMIFDIEVYDLKTQSSEVNAIQAGIDNFVNNIGNAVAAAILSHSLSTVAIEFN